MKICNTCNKLKGFDDFYIGSGIFGLESKCKSCKADYQRCRLQDANFKLRRKKYYKLKNKYNNIQRSHICMNCNVNFTTTTNPNITGLCRSCAKKNCDIVWTRNNMSLKSYNRALRRSRQKGATPRWLDDNLLKIIRTIYDNCPKGYHVDHIIPLTNDIVCGLHVPWNLQYLSAHENISKGNKLNEPNT